MYFNLYAEMSRNNITQKELCKKIGINSSTLSEKLNGKTDFKLSECEKIKKIFPNKLTIDYLFETKRK